MSKEYYIEWGWKYLQFTCLHNCVTMYNKFYKWVPPFTATFRWTKLTHMIFYIMHT